MQKILLNKIHLFRMTHIENVPHVLEQGITHKKSAHRNPHYVAIGDNSLIESRNNHPCGDAGFLGDYIPFYFGVRMPMLYVIQNGFNGVEATPHEKIVYCVTNIQKVKDLQQDFRYTDGHATDRLSHFYGLSDLPLIDQQIDFGAVKAQFWKREDDLDYKRRKEAEFLLKGDLPATAVLGYIVSNEQTKVRMVQLGVEEKIVIVKPEYYF